MAKTVIEKEVCGECGVDVRENTQFCYNCGTQVATDLDGKPVGDEGGKAVVKSDDKASDEKKLSRAAEERRKARVNQRRSNEYIWEPGGDYRLTFLVAILITVVVAAVVFLTVFWK